MRHNVGKLRIARHTADPSGIQQREPSCLALRRTSYRLVATRVLLSVALCSTALAGAAYQTGKLISITDSSSNRVVGNAQSGSVVTVTDVEYRLSVELGDMVYV